MAKILDSGERREFASRAVRDDVLGKMFIQGAVRSCPEPHVIKRYGVGGIANVSVWTCRKCRYVKTYKWHGGVSCGYMG